jgi:hypothetical protein
VKSADFANVPRLSDRHGKDRCDACDRELETGAPIRVFVFGASVTCGDCEAERRGPPSGTRVSAKGQALVIPC